MDPPCCHSLPCSGAGHHSIRKAPPHAYTHHACSKRMYRTSAVVHTGGEYTCSCMSFLTAEPAPSAPTTMSNCLSCLPPVESSRTTSPEQTLPPTARMPRDTVTESGCTRSHSARRCPTITGCGASVSKAAADAGPGPAHFPKKRGG